MSSLPAAATADAAVAADSSGPNSKLPFPIMQTPHMSVEWDEEMAPKCARPFKNSDTKIAQRALEKRVDEICEDEEQVEAAQKRAKQLTSPESKDEFNRNDIKEIEKYYADANVPQFLADMKAGFEKWWKERHPEFRAILKKKWETATEAQERNSTRPRDQQEPVDDSWTYHQQCICSEYLCNLWLDEQFDKTKKEHEKTRKKTRKEIEYENEERFCRAVYLSSLRTQAMLAILKVKMFD
ncbi:MAG: hypothetical protein Q9224_004981 [Gallowayella concinna]